MLPAAGCPIVISLPGTDFCSAHRSTEQRADNAVVEQPGQQRNKADYHQDGADHHILNDSKAYDEQKDAGRERG